MTAAGQLALPLSGNVARPPRAKLGPRVMNSYDAAAQTRRLAAWRAPTTSANQAILGNLATLRDRSRQAARNDGFAGGAIEKLVTNIVGTDVKPLSKATDPAFRKAVQELWLRWTDFSDADGLLDFYGQQAQVVRCWLEAGECFVRLRPRRPQDGLPVPLQIQVLEPELCPHTHTGVRGVNRVRAGIEFDALGRRVAYYFFAQRPGSDQDYDPNDLRRVPAENVIHLYDPLRAGQLRGLPHLTRALVRLHELERYEDATLLRSQIANLFAGFVTRPAGAESADVNPLTGLAADGTASDSRPIVSLEPGIMQELGPGEEIDFNDPPNADPFGAAFLKQMLMGVAAATGVPYEVLTGDMSGLNDRVMRVVLHEFRRAITARQHHIVAFQLCRRVWGVWLDQAFLAGSLPIPTSYLEDPSPWSAVRWMPQGWPYIHPVQDVTAATNAIKAGFTSRSAVVSEQGEDAEVIDAEQAEDNRRAEELGLTYESGTNTPEAPPPAPAPAPPPAKAEVPPIVVAPAPPVVNVTVHAPEPAAPPVVNVTVPRAEPAPKTRKDIRRDERGLIVSIADVEIPGSQG